MVLKFECVISAAVDTSAPRSMKKHIRGMKIIITLVFHLALAMNFLYGGINNSG